jgi:hypothetical protein
LSSDHHINKHPASVVYILAILPSSKPLLSQLDTPHPNHYEEREAKMFAGLQNPRNFAAQLMNFGLVLSTAFMVRCCADPSQTPSELWDEAN